MESRIHITILLAVTIMTLASITVSDSQAATYEYDALSRLTRVVYNNNKAIEYSYDAIGNRTRKISTLLADTSVDSNVDFQDFAIVASRWLDDDCGYADEWCSRADIDWSTEVGLEDLATIARQWLETI